HIKQMHILGSMDTPFSSYCHVLDESGSPVVTTVTVTNIVTNQTLNTTTDSSGYYEVELNELNFTNTDEIWITLPYFGVTQSLVIDDRNTSAEITFAVSGTGEQPLLLLLALCFLIGFRKK
ncbi:MAG: hypothetical protein QXJ27_06555, partial [Thermoplasmata archaeon]